MIIECPNCNSHNIKILDVQGDGDDIDDVVDVEFRCKNCGEIHWASMSESDRIELD